MMAGCCVFPTLPSHGPVCACPCARACPTRASLCSLQQFAEVQNLYRLPPSLEQLTLHVFELPRLLLPTHLCRLRELTVSSRELGVDLAALCGLVSELCVSAVGFGMVWFVRPCSRGGRRTMPHIFV